MFILQYLLKKMFGLGLSVLLIVLLIQSTIGIENAVQTMQIAKETFDSLAIDTEDFREFYSNSEAALIDLKGSNNEVHDFDSLIKQIQRN
jgi:hypothetical protein